MEMQMQKDLQIDISQLLFSVSRALDAVETELLGSTENHGKRVAYLAVLIGKRLGFTKEELIDLAASSLLHDNALTEYMAVENQKGNHVINRENLSNIEFHCVQGQKNMQTFPLFHKEDTAVLYHHENYNGTGLFQKKGDEIPITAHIIRLLDQADVLFGLKDLTEEKQKKMEEYLRQESGSLYHPRLVELFLEVLERDVLEKLRDSRIDEVIGTVIPDYVIEFTYEEFIEISRLFAHIIDYKSPFTMRHSAGIYEKTRTMAEYYQFDRDNYYQLQIAALFHDIGKLTVPNTLLDKPGKLTEEEFNIVKRHVYYTYEILSPMSSFHKIAIWASSHHEKLDGTGYFQGLKADKLDFNSRLLACIDIYQALVEDRPYRKGMTHEDAMKILTDMKNSGKLDPKIVDDLEQVFHG